MLSNRVTDVIENILHNANIPCEIDYTKSLAKIINYTHSALNGVETAPPSKEDLAMSMCIYDCMTYLLHVVNFNNNPELQDVLKNILKSTNENKKPVLLFILSTPEQNRLSYMLYTLELNQHSRNTLCVTYTDFYVKQLEKFKHSTNRFVEFNRFKPTKELSFYRYLYFCSPYINTVNDVKDILKYVNVKTVKTLTFTYDRMNFMLNKREFEKLSNLYEIKILDLSDFE